MRWMRSQYPILSSAFDLRTSRTSRNLITILYSVTLTIAKYDVARIFFDKESSVKIFFKKTLDHIKVDDFGFDPKSTALFGFTGHTVWPFNRLRSLYPWRVNCAVSPR